MNKKIQIIDNYINAAPKETRAKLLQLRRIIKSTAPMADERISYGMPYYEYEGRLAYFAAFKNHINLFVPPPIIEEHHHDLTEYKTAKATVRFPLDKPLPVMIIKKMIKARMKKNEVKTRNK